MKNIRTFVMVVILGLVFFSVNSFAKNSDKTIIKVGYISEVGINKNDLNSIHSRGYIYDLLKRMEYYSNYRFQYVEFDSRVKAKDALLEGKIDVVGPVFRSSEREKYFIFSPPISMSLITLTVKPENANKYTFDDPKSIDGKTVASYSDNELMESKLNEYCKNHGISVKYVRAEATNYIELDADIYLTTTFQDHFHSYVPILSLGNADLHFMANKNSKKLLYELDKVYEKAKTNDGNLLHALYNKYYIDTNLEKRVFSQREKDIFDSLNLKIAVNKDYRPYMYVNENGEFDGIVVNLFKKHAQISGIKNYTFIPYSLEDSLETNQEIFEKVNIVLSPEDKFLPLVDFNASDVFYSSATFFAIAKNNSFVSNKNMSIGKMRTLTVEDVTKYKYPQLNYVDYSSSQKLMSDFNSGKLDGVLITEDASSMLYTMIKREHKTIGAHEFLNFRLFTKDTLESSLYGLIYVMLSNAPNDISTNIVVNEMLKYQKTTTIIDILKENILYIVALASIIILAFFLQYLMIKRNKDTQYIESLTQDATTGLLLEHHSNALLHDILANAKPNEYKIIAIDIDNFRDINTIFGYEIGTKVIRKMAKSLVKICNKEYGLLSKGCAESFFICSKTTDITPEILCEKLSADIKSIVGRDYSLSLSCGVCVIDNTNVRISSIINFALLAKNKGKNQKSNTVYYVDEDIKEEEIERLNNICSSKRM